MAKAGINIIEACTYYSFKKDLSEEDIQAIKDAGFDSFDEDGYNCIDGQSIYEWNLEDYIIWESADFDDLECQDLLESWVGRHHHYLVFASGCRWNGASGYTICDNVLDTIRRNYDVTICYRKHSEGRALICDESSHDVPTGSTTVIVGLTDDEYEKLEDAEFSEVEAFAEQFID